MAEKKSAQSRKFGRIAYATAFVFIAVGTTLFQAVFRDRIPPDFVSGGWFDLNGALAGAFAGGFSGLIGALLGYGIERALSRPR
jgi:hypothetical protein